MRTIILNLKAVFLPEKILEDEKNQLFLENGHKKNVEINPHFDPIAVQAIQEMVDKTEANIVLSDSWFWTENFEITKEWIKRNGLNINFHKNYMTPKRMSSLRINEIQWWLENNSKDHLLLIIDENYTMKNLLKNSFEELKDIDEYRNKYNKYIGVKRRKSMIPQFEYLQYEEKKPFYGLETKRTLFINEKYGLTKEDIKDAWSIINEAIGEYDE